MKPLIIINFKNYTAAQGDSALKIARQLASVKHQRYRLALAPSLLHLQEVVNAVKVPQKGSTLVFAQHADAAEVGPSTGSITVAELKTLRVKGIILNHSEHRIPFSQIRTTLIVAKKMKLITVVCASTLAEARHIFSLHPEYLAYEPRELIGTNISVTEAKPKIIERVVSLAQKRSPTTKILCGAGIHSQADIQHALKLGASGVLLSHAIVTAKNPSQTLAQMLQISVQ